MYGKIFESMYEGSLIGSGPMVFAVMGYVIAKHKPDRKVGSYVELNPKIMAFIFGGGATEEEVTEAIEYLCEKDPKSTTPDAGGRRLLKLSQFGYQVVNGAKYRGMRDEEQRRQQNREAQARYRGKVAKGGKMLAGEGEAVKAAQKAQDPVKATGEVADKVTREIEVRREEKGWGKEEVEAKTLLVNLRSAPATGEMTAATRTVLDDLRSENRAMEPRPSLTEQERLMRMFEQAPHSEEDRAEVERAQREFEESGE
jgi:hypothetical protein